MIEVNFFTALYWPFAQICPINRFRMIVSVSCESSQCTKPGQVDCMRLPSKKSFKDLHTHPNNSERLF
jgi:hypothetical protein